MYHKGFEIVERIRAAMEQSTLSANVQYADAQPGCWGWWNGAVQLNREHPKRLAQPEELLAAPTFMEKHGIYGEKKHEEPKRKRIDISERISLRRENGYTGTMPILPVAFNQAISSCIVSR